MTAGSVLDALLEHLGEVAPGRPAVVVARPGVGKTPLVVHVALRALAAGKRVLHVSVGDGVEHVRVHYDQVLRATRGLSGHGLQQATLELLRQRVVLSYLARDFDPARLAAQARQLAAAAALSPDLIVVDGLDAHTWSLHAAALCALSVEFSAPLWVTVGVGDGTPPATDDAAAILELASETVGDAARMRLVHVTRTGRRPLPWVLDPTTLALADLTATPAPPARLRPSACTLYAGGAAGAESTFGAAAARHGLREVHFSFDGHEPARTEGLHPLSARELEQGEFSLVYVSRKLNRVYRDDAHVQRVLQLLWHVISRADQVFAIGAIQPDATVVGGTGWGVELARMWKKDLWVYDQPTRGWHAWDGRAWVPGTPHITRDAIAGTGTRHLEPHAADAVEALFARAFTG